MRNIIIFCDGGFGNRLGTLIGGLLVVISMYTIVFHESKPAND